MCLIKWLYEPKEAPLRGIYDLVVPIDYGSLRGERLLPKAASENLERAIRLVKVGAAHKIAWASTSFFGPSRESVDKEKFDFLEKYGIPRSSAQAAVERTMECVNSITEAERILQAVDVRRIIIICDWRHARRLRRIWKHFFKGELAVLTTDTQWNEDHPSFWCRSNLRWLIANVLHHTLLLMRGVEGMRKMMHPKK